MISVAILGTWLTSQVQKPLDLTGPLHMEIGKSREVEVTEEGTMMAPNIRMQRWGVGLGTTPSDDGQKLLEYSVTAIGARSSWRTVQDAAGQSFVLMSAEVNPSTINQLTFRSVTRVKLFGRTLVAGPPTEAVASLTDRNKWLRITNRAGAQALQTWLRNNSGLRKDGERDVVYAQRLLDLMQKSFVYKWDPGAAKGAEACVARGWGACGELNEIAQLALKLAQIPARMRQGRNILGERAFGTADDGTFHVAAEFWGEGIGWIPIEASAMKGTSLTVGGALVPYLGHAEPNHLSKHYDFAFLDTQPRSFQIGEWVFGSWVGSWDGWSISSKIGYKVLQEDK